MRKPLLLLGLPLLLSACAVTDERATLADLHGIKLELKDEKVDDGLEKAMAGYRQFIEKTPEELVTPEAIQRLADLSIEKEYGYLESTAATPNETIATPNRRGGAGESDRAFEERVAAPEPVVASPGQGLSQQADDLGNAEAEKAVEMYRRVLEKYPLYEGNEQVMYQLSHAYEELGQVEAAMTVMDRFVKTYPASQYIDEIQFRRAEYLFARKQYMSAEEAYQAVVAMDTASPFYELALYKLGWSLYKQELYEEALQQYIALLDFKLSTGYDFGQEADKSMAERIEDTFRVISLSFSNLGGADVVADYFSRQGSRSYEGRVYSRLGEYYLDKRRYSDAADAYKQFVALYPFDLRSPGFHIGVIEVYKKGGFGKLVLEAKKEFTHTYALDSPYWHHFDIQTRPDVVSLLKENIKDLAHHYHALYQDKQHAKEQNANYTEALLWYRNFLDSFPGEPETPALNYQMAELMMESGHHREAADAYENTAYQYPHHEKSAAAGYAAVYAYQAHLKGSPESEGQGAREKLISRSLKFTRFNPEHEMAATVLVALADDLYEMKNYERAVMVARQLIDGYPAADAALLRSAWLVVGHASFELKQYAAAENGYQHLLELMGDGDSSPGNVLENLAAAVYKQGEEANQAQDYRAAADHFLRVGLLVPQASIRPNAEYDGAEALIRLKDWERAAQVLVAFRADFPGHELQSELSKKLANVYRSAEKHGLAASEYERVERESEGSELGRGALLMAMELYKENDDRERLLAVYERYVAHYPRPAEPAIEAYNRMAEIYRDADDRAARLNVLKKMVDIDKAAGAERTDRTRYLGAHAALEMTEPLYDQFVAIKLEQPLKENLKAKKEKMKSAINGFTQLLDYGVADVSTAATYYMAEIYYHFSRALMDSERPKDLGDLELEQYEIALEEQSYPFEEKAIDVHKKNIELLHAGYYSHWIDRSIEKLAQLYPARYARKEEHVGILDSLDSYQYSRIKKPAAEERRDSGPDSGSGVRGNTPVAAEEGGAVSAAPAVELSVPDSGAGSQAPRGESGEQTPPSPEEADALGIL